MKPNTYTQLYVQLIFATKFRVRSLNNEFRKEVWSYISGIITNKEHKSIIVNGVPDHVHILVGLNPKMAISDLVRDIKRSSSNFINENKWVSGKFQWQDGYGAFSYSRSHLKNVYNYIKNQEIHHREKTFREEYLNLLKEHHVDFDERYLFDFFE